MTAVEVIQKRLVLVAVNIDATVTQRKVTYLIISLKRLNLFRAYPLWMFNVVLRGI